MKVSELKKKGNFVHIKFENSELLKIPYELFVKHNLYVGDEISEEKFENLTEQIEIYRIKQSAFRYLGLRNHSKSELKLKLVKKGYGKSLINISINDIDRLGYLDDKKFAEEYFNYQIKKKKGLFKIKAELVKKGIERKIIEELSAGFIDHPEFENSINQLVEKKLRLFQSKNYSKIQIKQKLYLFLTQKGFSTDLIQKSLDRKLKEINEEF